MKVREYIYAISALTIGALTAAAIDMATDKAFPSKFTNRVSQNDPFPGAPPAPVIKPEVEHNAGYSARDLYNPYRGLGIGLRREEFLAEQEAGLTYSRGDNN
jgi:hypothetical protein